MSPSWFEHVDLMQVLIGVCFIVISGLIVRTLKVIDRNQLELFKRVNTLERDFYELRGAHKVNHRVVDQ